MVKSCPRRDSSEATKNATARKLRSHEKPRVRKKSKIDKIPIVGGGVGVGGAANENRERENDDRDGRVSHSER